MASDSEIVHVGNIRPEDTKDKDVVESFIRSRIGRLNINADDYDIHVNKETGAVTAVPKDNLKSVKVNYDD